VTARVLTNEAATPTTRRIRLALAAETFSYRAGQAAALSAGGVPTPYSIASSPAETHRHGWLEFLIKVDGSNRFGAAVERLPAGAAVDVTAPFGAFTLERVPDDAPILFIAGGTGIAPVRAMIRDAADTSRKGSLSLVYSARTPDEFAYLPELSGLSAEGRLQLTLTLTGEAEAEDWAHARGRTGAVHLADLLQPSTVAFVCGPRAMVTELPTALTTLGVSRERIVTDARCEARARGAWREGRTLGAGSRRL
jgi:ferredoxin-NADP reductase